MLGTEPSAMCAVSAPRSSANHHPQEHFYWKEFISQVYQRCPTVYFPVLAFKRSGGPLHEEGLCYRHAAVFKDTKVTAFMNFHSGTYCFHQLLYLMCPCLHRFLRDLNSICFHHLPPPPPPPRLDENVFV